MTQKNRRKKQKERSEWRKEDARGAQRGREVVRLHCKNGYKNLLLSRYLSLLMRSSSELVDFMLSTVVQSIV